MVLSAPLAAPRSWVPRLPEPVVARPRLDALLAEGRRRQVTLVAAPPGAGKTTLLAGWVRRTYDVPAAWLTVEKSDDLPGRFVRSVVDALGGIGALAPRDSIGTDGDLSMLDDALHELSLAGHRAVLVLDDVHELTSAGSVAALGRLVERAPQELELLIASRADPPLRIGRLRVEGRLSEIRNADLLFTLTEAAELFQAHGLHVTQRDVLAIHERAEGWAAGLRLIAYAIEKGANPRRFALDGGPAEEAVSEYLLTEVLERQDEAVQRFLQRTSIVDELTPDLAIALCDDVDAGSRLADLERRGVFLTEVEGEALYRYHALFAALLRARLRHHDPELRRSLHRRAAAWYGSRNMIVAAEHHARAAEDWPVLGELVMSRWLQTMLAGQDPTHGLVDGLPDEVVLDTAQLSIVASATAAVRGDRDTTERLRKGCPEPGSAWPSDARRVEGEAAMAVADLVPRPGLRPVGGPRRHDRRGRHRRAVGGRFTHPLRVAVSCGDRARRNGPRGSRCHTRLAGRGGSDLDVGHGPGPPRAPARGRGSTRRRSVPSRDRGGPDHRSEPPARDGDRGARGRHRERATRPSGPGPHQLARRRDHFLESAAHGPRGRGRLAGGSGDGHARPVDRGAPPRRARAGLARRPRGRRRDRVAGAGGRRAGIGGAAGPWGARRRRVQLDRGPRRTVVERAARHRAPAHAGGGVNARRHRSFRAGPSRGGGRACRARPHAAPRPIGSGPRSGCTARQSRRPSSGWRERRAHTRLRPWCCSTRPARCSHRRSSSP